MPNIINEPYRPSWPFTNGHFSSVYPSLFRKIAPLPYSRKRVDTTDGDFFDLDMVETGQQKAVLICHGLEGNAASNYVVGMGNAFLQNGWNIAAMNYRGCSGEMNRTTRFYHSGFTEDFKTAIDFLVQTGNVQIVLVGFSLGANLILKYLGDGKFEVPDVISGAVVFSAPVDLHDASIQLTKRQNWIYTKRFLLRLQKKIKAKKAIMPGKIDDFHFLGIRNLIDFDDYYTAPLHGFDDALDYYRKNSSRQWLTSIRIPTLLVNALDDPFLGKQCYPFDEAEKNDNLFFYASKYGGHVGFYEPGTSYWSEKTAVRFAINKKKIDLM